MSFLRFAWLLFPLWQTAEVVPYKPSDEFKIELDFAFKQRSYERSVVVNFEETRAEQEKRLYAGGPLPYLFLNCKLLKLQEGEVKLRAVNYRGGLIFSKKASLETVYRIDMGYLADIKDGITPREFTIYLLSAKKKEISRIHFLVEVDGTWLINNEKRGKF